MSIKSIVFSPAMVRAMLIGAKTQMRMIVLPKHMARVTRPFDIGSRLRIKERWGYGINRKGVQCFVYAEDGYSRYVMAENGGDGDFCGLGLARKNYKIARWRSALHMPPWGSRFEVEITRVRIERLHDISPEDSLAEGMNARLVCNKIFSLAAGSVALKQSYFLEQKDGTDLSDEWCETCIDKAAKKHDAEPHSEDWPHTDSPRFCASCGCVMQHSLSEYGIDSELRLNQDDAVENYAVRDSDAAILANVTDGMGDLIERHHGRMAQIAFATHWNLNGGNWKSNPRVFVADLRLVSAGRSKSKNPRLL